MAARWSILIASHTSRVEKLSRLAGLLAPQLTPEVEAVVLLNRGGKFGDLRQALALEATGEWLSYVDDDDRVPDDYVASILGALESEPDYVGFDVEVTDIGGTIGRPGKKYRAIHSIRYNRWHQRGDTFYRHVSHLNPIRRDIALLAGWEGGYSEDHRWADRARPHVHREVYVDKVLYFYDFDQRESLRDKRVGPVVERPVLPAGFRYHPDSEQ